eukprot:323042-Pelagomonas_calceolata.AAC.2
MSRGVPSLLVPAMKALSFWLLPSTSPGALLLQSAAPRGVVRLLLWQHQHRAAHRPWRPHRPHPFSLGKASQPRCPCPMLPLCVAASRVLLVCIPRHAHGEACGA